MGNCNCLQLSSQQKNQKGKDVLVDNLYDNSNNLPGPISTDLRNKGLLTY